MKAQIKLTKNILFTALVFIGVGLKSQVFINEIMINPSGVNDGANMPNTAEWIEFYNGSASAIDMSCWFFTDGDFAVTFPSGTTIAAGGYYTVASAAGSGLTPNLNWVTCGCTSGPASEIGILTNSAEQVILYNSSGMIMDAVIWSIGQLPDGITTSVIGFCSSQTVTFPASGATYEPIGSNNDGVSKERSVDGGVTWQNTSLPTFGASNATVLPIELLYFNAIYNGKYVNLNWSTATEINNDYFTIERSSDGLNFESLLIAKGSGNTTSQINYANSDEDPIHGISYYRLKQTDFDGNFSYSHIVSVSSQLDEDYKIYPNPNESGLLKISSGGTSGFEVKIIDALGRVIYNEYTKDSTIQLDLTSFGKGVYIVSATSNDLHFIKKVIYN